MWSARKMKSTTTNYIEIDKSKVMQEINEHRTRVENFVKTFIYLLVNWKFSFLENAFDVKENILKLLLKKQIFKCNYLNNSTIEFIFFLFSEKSLGFMSDNNLIK